MKCKTCRFAVNKTQLVVENLEALRLYPESRPTYEFLLPAYLALNRIEEALATAKEAQARNLDVSYGLYQIHFLRNDASGMADQVSLSAGKQGVEDVLLGYQADTAAFSGQLGKAREFSFRAIAAAERAEEKEAAAWYGAQAALREAFFGNASEAQRRAALALKLSSDRDVRYLATLALCLIGDESPAAGQTDDLAKGFPKDTIALLVYLPTLRAQLSLIRGDISSALENLRVAVPAELGTISRLHPVYVRGEVLLAAHRGNEAEAEFQKILDHRGVVVNAPIGALAHLQLGRAYLSQGDTAKAKSAYQGFLTLWKDADPDIPVFIAAKAEYAKLK